MPDNHPVQEQTDGFARFLRDYPEIERIDAMIVDMNGLLRGKWIPSANAQKIAKGDLRLPLSTSALDMWGHDVDGSGLGIESGDRDGSMQPVMSSLVPVPWAGQPAGQILMMMSNMNGALSPYDPRARLVEMLARYQSLGWTPVVATELEFFVTARGPHGRAPQPLDAANGSHLYDFAQMSAFEPLLSDIRSACEAQGIPADAAIAESGVGQFEINFEHQSDAVKAADHAVMFRRLVKGVAQKHGVDATFMAKPYGEQAGSGMHVHVSVLDAAGANIFNGNAARLGHAVGGQLASMAELQLIFAPNLNSYRRFSREGFAPTEANWGFDHRAAAVRIPEADGRAARFEHRLCGADVNPYLAITAILGGALKGLEEKIEPGAPIDEDLGSSFGVVGWDWQAAVHRFQSSKLAADIFGMDFARVFALVKQDEIAQLTRQVSDVEFRTYLSRI